MRRFGLCEGLSNGCDPVKAAQKRGGARGLLQHLEEVLDFQEPVLGQVRAMDRVLDAIAAGLRDVPAMKGWRREVFGEDALRLCEGQIGLAAEGTNIRIIKL